MTDQNNVITWQRWDNDPVAAATGISFNREPAGLIRAPKSMFRICAYHIDWDERPVCYVDVGSLAEAEQICARLFELCRYNVDYALTYDDTGAQVTARPW